MANTTASPYSVESMESISLAPSSSSSSAPLVFDLPTVLDGCGTQPISRLMRQLRLRRPSLLAAASTIHQEPLPAR